MGNTVIYTIYIVKKRSMRIFTQNYSDEGFGCVREASYFREHI